MTIPIYRVYSKESIKQEVFASFLRAAIDEYYTGDFALAESSVGNCTLTTNLGSIELTINSLKPEDCVADAESVVSIAVEDIVPVLTGMAWEMLVVLSLTECSSGFSYWLSTYSSEDVCMPNTCATHVVSGVQGILLSSDEFDELFLQLP